MPGKIQIVLYKPSNVVFLQSSKEVGTIIIPFTFTSHFTDKKDKARRAEDIYPRSNHQNMTETQVV